MSAFMGEMVGTMILIIFGGGVVAGGNLKKTYANGSGWVLITIAWGLAVTMGVFAVGSISGAHLNPAVSLAFAITGDLAWNQVPVYILAQIVGAFIGATLVFLHYFPHWKATDDPAAKLSVFSTGPAIPHTFSNLLGEMLGTFMLIFGLLFIGANEFTEGLNPIAVGLLIVAIGMSLGGTTGYAINPARDFGPRIAHFLLPIAGKGNSNWQYAWVPVVGPILGGSLGAIFYFYFFKGVVLTGTWIVLVINIVVLLVAFFMTKNNQEMIEKKAA